MKFLYPLIIIFLNNTTDYNIDNNIDNNNIIHKNMTCSLCKDLVNTIDYDIKFANQTFNEIKKVVEYICDKTIDPIGKKECNIILNDIGKILNWITEGVPTQKICEDLHYCNKTNITIPKYRQPV